MRSSCTPVSGNITLQSIIYISGHTFLTQITEIHIQGPPKKCIHTLTKENSTLYKYNTKPGLRPGFVLHKGIPIAIVRLRH